MKNTEKFPARYSPLEKCPDFSNTLIIVRHGHSQANRSHIIASSPLNAVDGYGLTEKGKMEVSHSVASAFDKGLFDGSIVIYSSPFLRTIETSNIIERRFGLKSGKRETLEAIGQSLSLTRERIRQIESEGLKIVKPKIEESKSILNSFSNELESFGGVKEESELLDILGENKYQNQIFFFLANSNRFERVLENDKFHTFWKVEKNADKKAKDIIIEDIQSGESEILASTNDLYPGPRTIKYSFNRKGIDLGIQAIDKGTSTAVLVVDEIGQLELRAEGFNKVLELIKADKVKHCILVIRRELLSAFLSQLPIMPLVFETTVNNRNELPQEIGSVLLEKLR